MSISGDGGFLFSAGELETAVQLFGIDAQPLSNLSERLQSQFSATLARARRLDMQGERIGCIGALTAARAMVASADAQ